MSRRLPGLILALSLLPAVLPGAEPAPVLPAPAAPRPGMAAFPVPPSSTPLPTEVAREQASLNEAEGSLREAYLEIAKRQAEVQMARIRLDLARTEAEASAASALGTRAGRARSAALMDRAGSLKNIVIEDFPAIRILEGRLEEARRTEDTPGMAAIQSELSSRRRQLARHQAEADLAMAKWEKNQPRVRALERRIEELGQQERRAGGNRPRR